MNINDESQTVKFVKPTRNPETGDLGILSSVINTVLVLIVFFLYFDITNNTINIK